VTPLDDWPADRLFQLLRPERLTSVVGIGANPVDGNPPYKALLDRRLCTVAGFEPQSTALDALRRKAGPRETYLPYAIGDGTTRTLHVCTSSGMTSFLKPDDRALSLFPLFPDLGRVVSTHPTPTRPLDSVEEIGAMDLLHVDVQGSELDVFRSGREKLSSAVAVQTEVSFVPLYEGQPTIGVLDSELRSQGFIPHAFVGLKRWILAPMVIRDNPREAMNQLLEGDMVYVRDLRNPEAMTAEQLKHLALIAHHCYRSFDLALFCLKILDQRECLTARLPDDYFDILNAGPAPA
jgi:FkbM family methyltransferase